MSDDPAESVVARLGVSRETIERLRTYVAVLQKWQRKINLIGPATRDDIWNRHILDSAQLVAHLPQDAARLIDLGSGAGFPGLVLAILGQPEVILIESDRRKASFLREAARHLDCTGVTVIAERIEGQRLQGKVITARALAPLEKLVAYAEPLLEPGGICLFLKGRDFSREIEDARRFWNMRISVFPSATSDSGKILKLDEVSRVQ